MKQFVTLTVAFLLTCTCGQAQIMKDWGWEELGKANIVCQYQYRRWNSVSETTVTETMLLEIGSGLSKFYNYDTFEYDSLGYTPEGKKILDERFNECLREASKAPKKEQMSIMMQIPCRESEFIIYKNYPEQGKMLVQDAASYEYYKYTELLPLQSWEIGEDTTSIAGYPCQKAVCQWRGRDYTAWFTTDIPLSDGPYKFCGLPGLIMKVEDSEHLFCFTLEGMRQVNDTGILVDELRETDLCFGREKPELYHQGTVCQSDGLAHLGRKPLSDRATLLRPFHPLFSSRGSTGTTKFATASPAWRATCRRARPWTLGCTQQIRGRELLIGFSWRK